MAHSPTTPTSTRDTADHVTTQDTTRNIGPSTPSIDRTSSNEWLEVQDVGAATFKACRNDRTLDLDAFFGRPYAAKSKDGKTRRVRDCNQCAKKGYPPMELASGPYAGGTSYPSQCLWLGAT